MKTVTAEIPRCDFPTCTKLVHTVGDGSFREFRGRILVMCTTHQNLFDAGHEAFHEALYAVGERGLQRVQAATQGHPLLQFAVDVVHRGLVARKNQEG